MPTTDSGLMLIAHSGMTRKAISFAPESAISLDQKLRSASNQNQRSTSARIRNGLDEKEARLTAGSYATEDLFYDTLNEIADARKYGDDEYILGCDKERAFEPF